MSSLEVIKSLVNKKGILWIIFTYCIIVVMFCIVCAGIRKIDNRESDKTVRTDPVCIKTVRTGPAEWKAYCSVKVYYRKDVGFLIAKYADLERAVIQKEWDKVRKEGQSEYIKIKIRHNDVFSSWLVIEATGSGL